MAENSCSCGHKSGYPAPFPAYAATFEVVRIDYRRHALKSKSFWEKDFLLTEKPGAEPAAILWFNGGPIYR